LSRAQSSADHDEHQVASASDDLPEMLLQSTEDFRESDRFRQDLGK
jgi:hypothetical protein